MTQDLSYETDKEPKLQLHLALSSLLGASLALVV